MVDLWLWKEEKHCWCRCQWSLINSEYEGNRLLTWLEKWIRWRYNRGIDIWWHGLREWKLLRYKLFQTARQFLSNEGGSRYTSPSSMWIDRVLLQKTRRLIDGPRSNAVNVVSSGIINYSGTWSHGEDCFPHIETRKHVIRASPTF